MLPEDLRRVREGARADDLRARTYASFGFEWKRFSAQLPEYEENFHWYLEPLKGQPLAGCRVLDAGCGMGRHTHHLLRCGCTVVALDASAAIDVARANNHTADALFVQADILHLPLESEAFDLACCLGVLHHIEDTRAALKELVRVVRPGGLVLVYVYHDLSHTGPLRRGLLRAVTEARRLTTRTPLPLLRVLTLLLAGLLWATYVGPAKLLSRSAAMHARIAALPLGQYIDYPFRVLWNDQFDRFSAPLEKRYTREQVLALLAEEGLGELTVLGGYGWRAAGRKPGAEQVG